jgi:hypothetical protein
MIAGLPERRGPDVSSATGTPGQSFDGGSGWLAPVDGNSDPGLRFKALANRSDPCVRCQRLASRASRSSSPQCQGPSGMRRRIRTGPWTAQTAVRFTGSSCSSTCVVRAMLESSPQRAPSGEAFAALAGPDRLSGGCLGVGVAGRLVAVAPAGGPRGGSATGWPAAGSGR